MKGRGIGTKRRELIDPRGGTEADRCETPNGPRTGSDGRDLLFSTVHRQKVSNGRRRGPTRHEEQAPSAGRKTKPRAAGRPHSQAHVSSVVIGSTRVEATGNGRRGRRHRGDVTGDGSRHRRRKTAATAAGRRDDRSRGDRGGGRGGGGGGGDLEFCDDARAEVHEAEHVSAGSPEVEEVDSALHSVQLQRDAHGAERLLAAPQRRDRTPLRSLPRRPGASEARCAPRPTAAPTRRRVASRSRWGGACCGPDAASSASASRLAWVTPNSAARGDGRSRARTHGDGIIVVVSGRCDGGSSARAAATLRGSVRRHEGAGRRRRRRR